MPSNIEYLEFKVKKEVWNIYEVIDGSKIKAKFVLIKIVKDELTEKLGLSVNAQKIITVIPPPKLRGPPSSKQLNFQELTDSIVDDDMEFKAIKDDWNVYELEDGTKIKAKLFITSISKTDKFDTLGDPIYSVQSQPVTKTLFPKKK